MVRVDLHTHSTASDGSLDPAALVGCAAAVGLDVLALTDHDTMSGVEEALDAGGPPDVICGIELSVRWPEGTFHLLGHFAEVAPGPIADRLDDLARARDIRNAAMLERLSVLGIALDPVELAIRAGRARPSRRHIADALVAAGHAADRGDAFERWIGTGAPAYVPLGILEPVEAVRLVKHARGAASLAHPATLRLTADALDDLLAGLRSAGLDGLEVHRGDASPELQQQLAAMAARHGLIATGGSDYHGPELEGEGRRLGDTGLPGARDETQRALLERIA